LCDLKEIKQTAEIKITARCSRVFQTPQMQTEFEKNTTHNFTEGSNKLVH